MNRRDVPDLRNSPINYSPYDNHITFYLTIFHDHHLLAMDNNQLVSDSSYGNRVDLLLISYLHNSSGSAAGREADRPLQPVVRRSIRPCHTHLIRGGFLSIMFLNLGTGYPSAKAPCILFPDGIPNNLDMRRSHADVIGARPVETTQPV